MTPAQALLQESIDAGTAATLAGLQARLAPAAAALQAARSETRATLAAIATLQAHRRSVESRIGAIGNEQTQLRAQFTATVIRTIDDPTAAAKAALRKAAEQHAAMGSESALLGEALKQLSVDAVVAASDKLAADIQELVKTRDYVQAAAYFDIFSLWLAIAPALKEDGNVSIQLDRGSKCAGYSEKLSELDMALSELHTKHQTAVALSQQVSPQGVVSNV
jgi:hypothetical protein